MSGSASTISPDPRIRSRKPQTGRRSGATSRATPPQGYTTDASAALIGLGAAAIGALPQGYVQNHTDTRRYLEEVGSNRLPVAEGVVLTEDGRTRRAAIEQPTCSLRLDTADPRFTPLAAAAVFDAYLAGARRGRHAAAV